VDAIGRGMSKAEAARTFGVGISTLKRYMSKVHRGEPLEPGKAPGRAPKIGERERKLLEEDLKESVPSPGSRTDARLPASALRSEGEPLYRLSSDRADGANS
jgi:transposase